MLKLNWIATWLLFFTGCTNAMTKNMTKFDWLATESAPSHYPMEIIQGEFFYHGQGGSRYIPSGGTLRAGWGNFISTHVGGDELYPLPDKVKILFFSYTENQFYQGEFNLPYEKMVLAFQEGITANKESPLYSRVMIGVAPGGSVAVWLAGSKTTEMFFGQAEKIDLRYGKVLGLQFANKQEEDAFIYRQLIDVLKPEELEALKKNGVPFGLWSRYRKDYLWNFKSGNDVNFREGLIGIRYLKGDSDRVIFPFEPRFIKTPRPLPRRMPIKPQFSNKNTNFVIYFNEFELMDAFEKLGANGELVTIECNAKMPREDSRFRVYNDKESIELTKTAVSDR